VFVSVAELGGSDSLPISIQTRSAPRDRARMETEGGAEKSNEIKSDKF